MQPGKLAVVCVAALALISLTTPADAAAVKKPYEGWFGALDFALTQPDSLDQHYADKVNFGSFPYHAERLVIDNDTDFTFRATVGYSWGKMGSLQVSYWSFDNTDTVDGNGGASSYLYPSVVAYSYYGGQTLGYSTKYRAESNVKASTIDIDYVRPMSAGDKFSVRWLAGLRVASYGEDLAFSGDDGYYLYKQSKHMDADAAGFRVGATAVFDFTETFSLEGSLAVSFMRGSTDGYGLVSDDTGAPYDRVKASDDNIRAEIREYGLKAVWNIGPADLFIGYDSSNWDGLVTDPVTTNVGGYPWGGSPQRARDSIAFNSFTGGVRWRFGGRM